VQQRHLPIYIAQTVKFVEIAKMSRLILDGGEGGRLVGRVAWNDSFLLAFWSHSITAGETER